MRTFSLFLFGRLTAWREWRYAKRSGQTALDLYRRLRAEQPELSGKELYEAFVCRRNGIGPSDARTILLRAETSFAAWPNERDLIFRDVVEYLVISEYLVSNPDRAGTTIYMTHVLAQMIPKEL